jgi:hypothetical protein
MRIAGMIEIFADQQNLRLVVCAQRIRSQEQDSQREE